MPILLAVRLLLDRNRSLWPSSLLSVHHFLKFWGWFQSQVVFGLPYLQTSVLLYKILTFYYRLKPWVRLSSRVVAESPLHLSKLLLNVVP